MAWLKGMVENGYVRINRSVKFMKDVQFAVVDPWSTVWYVDGNNGSDSNNGRGPAAAKATIQAAVTASSTDDVIYIRSKGAGSDASDPAYYTETITVPYANTNLSMIGVTPHVFDAYYGPWLRYGYTDTDAAYVLLNYAPGLNIANMTFQVGDYIRSSYGAIHLYGSTTGGAYTTHAGSVGATLRNCHIRDGNLNIEGGYYTSTVGCTFQASASSTASWRNKSSTLPSGGHRLINSHFSPMFGDNQTVMYVLGIAGAHKNMLIRGCTFGEKPADGHYMWFGSSNTGIVADCYFRNGASEWGTNDTNSELYSADAGVKFVGCYDDTGAMITST